MHCNLMHTMREDLAAMGHPLSDSFYSIMIILSSLPHSYDPHIFAINVISSIVGKTICPDKLMRTFTDEFNCRGLKARRKGAAVTKRKGKEKEKDEGGTAKAKARDEEEEAVLTALEGYSEELGIISESTLSSVTLSNDDNFA
jgi:hypothetical protein